MEFTEKELAELQNQLALQLTEPRSQALVDATAVSELDSGEIERSRETLIRKRIAQTRYQLPHCARVMGKQFPSTFRIFASNHHFNGLHAIRDDAIAFANWLIRHEHSLPGTFDEFAKAELQSVARIKQGRRT